MSINICMVNWNDILIIGDSFCAARNEDFYWPNRLCNKLTGKTGTPRGHGFGGIAWWSTRKKLIEELSNAPVQILIMCHAEAQRIPSDYDIPFNIASVTSGGLSKNYQDLNKKYPMEDFMQAAQMYYKYLHSQDFHDWTLNQWFNELPTITSGIPHVIHLPCFNQSVYPHPIGIRCKTALFDWVADPHKPRTREHANHMSIEENARFSDIMYDVVVNYLNNPECEREFNI
jgi:hypothetical protein